MFVTWEMLFLFAGFIISLLAYIDNHNHNHPSNRWYAQGLKAQYYQPAAQAAGFCFCKSLEQKYPSIIESANNSKPSPVGSEAARGE